LPQLLGLATEQALLVDRSLERLLLAAMTSDVGLDLGIGRDGRSLGFSLVP
jgi:hypothetical protein